MATTVKEYVHGCVRVLEAKPAYKLGAASLTECDCIGMNKYAFHAAGVNISTTGTNFSARYQVDGLHRITSEQDLCVGAVVFKARDESASGYALPSRYRAGGKYHNGDLLDYYHIGTVRSLDPLQIIHMTGPTAKTDTDWHKWTHTGRWKPAYISDYPDAGDQDPAPTPEKAAPAPDQGTARVCAQSGSTVNMRKEPKVTSALIDRIPVGKTVSVTEYGPVWTRVRCGAKAGYIMTKFLTFGDADSPRYTVTVPGLTLAQAQELCGAYYGTRMVPEKGV